MTFSSTPETPLDVAGIRAAFPILDRTVNEHPLTYLDSGATSQRPRCVLDKERAFLTHDNSAIHRGAHTLAAEATELFEEARLKVATFVGAAEDELCWASGATGAANTIATAIGNASAGRGGEGARRFALREGDEIVLTEAEHHANLIPWQELAFRTGATLRHIPVLDDGRLDLEAARALINDSTKIVAFAHVSNVLGIVNPVEELVALAQQVGALTVLDACQSVPHLPVNFTELGVDLAFFSGHKMYGPNGIGALFGRRDILNALPPAHTGGSMITTVTLNEAKYLPAPLRFEPGTQPVSQIIGLGAAVDFLTEIGMDHVHEQERLLEKRLRDGLRDIPGIRLFGDAEGADRVALASFVVDGVHAHDAGQYLDAQGIAVRVGHHCAQPLHARFGVAATVRASAAVHTTTEEIDQLIAATAEIRPYFGVTE